MKKLTIFFLCAFLVSFPALCAETQTATVFAQKLADAIMDEVVRSKTPLEKKQEAFRKTFISAVNAKSLARFTLGRYAKNATPEQIDVYTTALINNIVYTWTDRFNNYAGETIIFVSARESENGDVYVTSKIDLPNTQNDIEIIWRIVEKKNEMKLADLVVEGVSMLMSYRSEYTSILQQNGGDISALVKQLETKNITLKNPVKKTNE